MHRILLSYCLFLVKHLQINEGMFSLLDNLSFQEMRDRERRVMDLHRKTYDLEQDSDCQHKLLEDIALLLACMKYLLLKTTALEEAAWSHTVFGFSHLSLECRTGRELSLVPDRAGETFTNRGLAAEHAHPREMRTQSSVACSLIHAAVALLLCQWVSVAGKE